MNPESTVSLPCKAVGSASHPLFILPFVLTLFGSSVLMFFIQPMIGKMLLPRLGGTAQVWNACMVFFQLVLFAGYLYAHYSGVLLGQRRQAAVHIGLAIAALLALPIGMSPALIAPDPDQPILWLMQALLISVGAPLFVISSTAPLVQKWFSGTRHPGANDPYFLYVASNLGSLLALITYPTLIEPFINLGQQAHLLTAGFLVLVMSLVLCAALFYRDFVPTAEVPQNTGPAAAEDRVPWRSRLRWLILSFAPSSLLLGVTTHITTDIAAVPLFWILPLALYLLSFVVVFAQKPWLPHFLSVRAQALAVTLLIVTMPLVSMVGWLMQLIHLLVFFLTALVCHGELARSRPAARHVTEFYLWLSAGGVLGGAFNALLAPVIFTLPLEYPLMLALACSLRPYTTAKSVNRGDLLLPVGLGLGILLAERGADFLSSDPAIGGVFVAAKLAIVMTTGLVLMNFSERPVRFALGVTAILIHINLLPLLNQDKLGGGVNAAFRSFYGIYKVQFHQKLNLNVLTHGTVVHGVQSRQAELMTTPMLYYAQSGPFGDLFTALADRLRDGRIAVIGLGVGSLTCYGAQGSHWTYYEIDPLIERIARNPEYFTYLRDCQPTVNVVIGDARLSLHKAPDHAYNLIVVDAFSSDAIPTHLLTLEAISEYLTKLAPDGVLALHISNKHLDLGPIVGTLARRAGLVARVNRTASSADTAGSLSAPTQLVVLARNEGVLGALANDARWQPLNGRDSERVWSDDYVNILGAFRWFGEKKH